MTANGCHCVITARGGSKGIPRKNLRSIGGLPLVARSIRAAQASTSLDSVVVSTDDLEIADVATSFGAEVMIRPPELSGDESSSEEALLHFLHTKSLRSGKLLLVQPTSPFVQGSDIDAVISTLRHFDSCLTVTDSHGFLWHTTRNGELVGVNHDARHRLRRQDIGNEEYLENGAVYGMDIEMFLVAKHRFFGRIGFVKMSRLRSIEVDSRDDLELAEHLSRVLDAPR